MKLFIIHGWTYSLDAWDKVIALLQDAGFEPQILKVPGLSTPTNHPWTLDDYTSWLREQIADEENPIVIAHSNGGRIAMNYDIHFPGHLKQLILIDSAGIPRREGSVSLKRLIAKPIARVLKPITHPRLRRIAYRIIGASDYGQADEHMRETMKHMLASDETLDIESVSVPVDIIWGSVDSATPLADAHELKRRLPGARKLIVIEHAQHSPHKTHPYDVVNYIKELVGDA